MALELENKSEALENKSEESEHDELAQFLKQYDLYEDLFTTLIEQKLNLNLLKKVKENQIKMLCDDLGINTILCIRFRNAMEQLRTIDNNVEMKIEKDDWDLQNFLDAFDLRDVLYNNLMRHGLGFAYLSDIREDDLDNLFCEMQIQNKTAIKIKFRKALRTLNNKSAQNTKRRKMEVIFLGDSGVGKTSVIDAYLGKQYNDDKTSSSGVQDVTKTQQLSDGSAMEILLRDTAGQETYNSIVTAYYKRADVIMLCYDISTLRTVRNCREIWEKQIADHAKDDVLIFLVGCKRDRMKNDVASIEQRATIRDILKIKTFWNRRYKIVWQAECSALTGDNIRNIFATSAEGVYQQRQNTAADNLLQYQTLVIHGQPGRSSCC